MLDHILASRALFTHFVDSQWLPTVAFVILASPCMAHRRHFGVHLEAPVDPADALMITLEDCVAFWGLTKEEVLAIAEHEHLPEIAAAALGSYLVHQ
jgi:hypothetical protein